MLTAAQATGRSLWDTALSMYVNLCTRLNTTLVGNDRQWLAHLPPPSGALGFAELVHRFGTPVHDKIVVLIDAGDRDDWAEVEHFARDLLASVPAPFNALAATIDLTRYEPEFFHLLARYAHGFIVLVNDLNAVTLSSGYAPQQRSDGASACAPESRQAP